MIPQERLDAAFDRINAINRNLLVAYFPEFSVLGLVFFAAFSAWFTFGGN